MGNLIRMDLYRMNRGQVFRVCLILAFVFSMAQTPLLKLMTWVATLMSDATVPPLDPTADLGTIIAGCFPRLAGLVTMLSVVSFFNADMEHGYIKNIAGQMPKRGFSILSRYAAAIVHNAAFMLAALAGHLIGTMIFQRIVTESSVSDGILIFCLRLLILQSISAILLLTAASFRNKSLGTVLAVMIGLGAMPLIYLGIDTGLRSLLKQPDFSISPYMPDTLLYAEKPDTVRALLVSAVTIGIFLPLSIRVFDRKDVK